MSVEKFRAYVRPVATYVLLGAFVGYAFFNPDAFERIKDTAIMVVAYWFGTRSARNSDA